MDADVSLSRWPGLTDDALKFLDTVDRLARTELAPDGTWDRDDLRRCAAIGLQGLLVADDNSFDSELLPLATASSELLTSYAPATAVAVGTARIHALILAEHASEKLRAQWLPGVMAGQAIGSMAISESEAGSDVRAIRTVATRTDGGWRLTGEKAWVTMGPAADYSVVLSKIDHAGRDADMGVFLVERGQDGVTYGGGEDVDTFDVPLGSLSLTDAFVTAENVLSDHGGFSRILVPVNYARLEAACTGVGIQRGALRIAALYAGEREAFGGPIKDHQAVQLKLGRMATRFEASAAFLQRTASTDFGALDHNLLSALKVFTTDAALTAATDLIDVLGANGLYSHSLPTAFLNGAKAAQIYDGTADINLMNVGRAVARRAADSPSISTRRSA